MSTLVLATFSQIISFTLVAQEQQLKPIKKISISDIYILPGLSTEFNDAGTLIDFKALAPQSVLLNNDFTGYSSGNGISNTSGTALSIMLGIQFSDKQKTAYRKNPLLRLGFSYFSGTNLSNSLYREVRKRFDTLTSNQTANTAYLDSVTTNNYRMNYSSKQLRLDASLIYRTNPQARWSLFGGIGITAGLSINANTKISSYKIGRVDASFPNSSSSYFSSRNESYFSNPNDNKKENYRNKTNFGLSTYIPMGVDFRIGKKREFWKRTHLFSEFRPSINITSIPELRTMANISMQYGVGLRISID